MSKTVREKRLDSAAARAKLKASGKPYWRAIDTGLHLGYRKGLAGGRWVVRRYLGDEKYAVETIGTADDHSPADDDSVLDFFQAQRKAREVAAAAKTPAGRAPFTVAVAMDAYFERLEHEGSKSLADARGRARIHILPPLGDKLVADLTRDMLAQWLTRLAGKPEGTDATPRPPCNRQPRPDHPARGAEPILSRRQGCVGCPLADRQAISRGRHSPVALFH
jgi:hypothetical protein